MWQVLIKGVHLVSLMGNKGTFDKRLEQQGTDGDLLYHVVYLIFCVLGLSVHPFCYSVLVSRLPSIINTKKIILNTSQCVWSLFILRTSTIYRWENEVMISLLPTAVWRSVPGRDVAQCDSVRDAQRLVHHPHCSPCPHPCLHVLHHWLYVLQEWLCCRCHKWWHWLG